MPVLKVFDKELRIERDAIVDKEDFERLKDFRYLVDKNSLKPFREFVVDGKHRRMFLARDVKGFTYGDGKIAGYLNDDYFDCRRSNVVEKTAKGSRNVYWPRTFQSLLNFLDSRVGIDEESASLYLMNATDFVYSRKKITLIYDENIYQDFQKNNILDVIKRVLQKHFNWAGELSVVKSLKYPMHNVEKLEDAPKVILQPLQIENVPETTTDTVKKEMPVMLERASERIRVEKEKTASQSPFLPDIRLVEREFAKLSLRDRLNIIRKGRIVPTEDLIKLIMERGANSNSSMTIQFTSK